MENAKNGASESLTYSSLEASQMQPEVPDFLTSIKNALEGPNVYNFANLLVHPNVRKLKNTAHTNYLHTLHLFAYGTYKEYLANRGNYIELSDAMENKLKHLTIERMAIRNTCIPYEDLCARLNVNVDSDLEQLINETIAAGLIQGSSDAMKRELRIDYVISVENIGVQMIENALGKLNVCDFTTLLAHPNVRKLKNTAHTNYLHTLQLFAYDTYKEYMANRGNYIVLSDAMENKLKHLTIVKMAFGNKCIPYEDLRARLNVKVDSDLEQLINETIAAGFIQGGPDAVNRVLKIDYIVPLDIRGKRLKSFWERIIGSKVQQRWIELSVHILGMRDKLVGKRKHYAYK
ncbi:uncharacterized protein LOC129573219 isoform X2 [Sitodiplosis mosellana]|uniref:uncharacterized protein LOC129573219 isoform X2 n=1 Tax=Sitodiplosis mosellana TaxID=263140 RepID=UPI002444C21D|nr:uncharacterized protein LOC129573219 isoform X2 [Sitodiplosis mosellana]XP_055309520.1 uncharacterized protein LOC129573219 isoform X2 [Sitodiplosis mosellana]